MSPLSFVLERSGNELDRVLVQRADAALAVSPRIADQLASASGVDVRWLPLPWPIPRPIAPEERLEARRTLGFYEDDEVLLYAGNLDSYQGLNALFEAHTRTLEKHPTLRLLLATASDSTRLDLPRGTRVVRLECNEAQRRMLHAAANLVVIPRETEGGLPIKLIDALARGVPVACVKRATAGLPLHGCAAIAAEHELGAAVDSLLRSPVLASEFGEAGRAWVAREMSAARFLSVFDDALNRARGRRHPLIEIASATITQTPRAS
jgi:glycosyltransferase involved in cell wall biosynthesis